jgi:hypothetical protein
MMSQPPLSVYWGSEEQGEPKANVRLHLRDLWPLLIHAHRHNAAWLRDLENDEVIVTEDLAEIIAELSHQLNQRKSA